LKGNKLLVADEAGGSILQVNVASLDPTVDPAVSAPVEIASGLLSPGALASAGASESSIFVSENEPLTARVRRVGEGQNVVVAGDGNLDPVSQENAILNQMADVLSLREVVGLAANETHLYLADKVAGVVVVVERDVPAGPGGEGPGKVVNIIQGLERPAGLALDSGDGLLVLESSTGASVSGEKGHKLVRFQDPNRSDSRLEIVGQNAVKQETDAIDDFVAREDLLDVQEVDATG
jgi:hypothetical protein